MKLCHTLISFFFLSLQGGSPGLVNAEGHRIYKEIEGANITVKCFFTYPGSRKYFCKQNCEDLILVNTTADSAENGRYSIEYRRKYLLSHPVLLVNITQLTKSDSGWYRCGLDKSWIQNSYKDFEIIVTNASDTSGPDWTLSSTLGSFTPFSASPETTTQSGLQQTESKKRFRRLLSVGVALAVKIVLLSLAVLFFRCRRRASKPVEPPVEKQNATVSETNREDEDISEDRQSRSPPPVETSSIYAYVNYSNCPTAAGSQCKAAADDSSDLSYSVVEFSRVSTTSLNRTTRANANDGIYSVLQLKVNSDASHKDASSPLYSTVTFPLQ